MDNISYIERVLGHKPLKGIITRPVDTELTYEEVKTLIAVHQTRYVPRYELLKSIADGQTPIFSKPAKDLGKPDNRVSVNFAEYIVNTLDGFFIGVPIKTYIADETKNTYINAMNIRNNQADVDAELSKDCSELGTAFEMLYQTEDAGIGTTKISPMNCFVVYDDTILHKPMWGIRYDYDDEGTLYGSVSDRDYIYWFRGEELDFESDPEPHAFGDVPIIQYKQNEDYHSAFESALSMFAAYDDAISEKANDVSYFADAYLKILGARLSDDDKQDLRDMRLINLVADPEQASNVVVEFIGKPESDQTQENLLDRLEKLIYKVTMVPDMSDESFAGNSSGVALKYKLQGLSNLAMIKERKFKAAIIDKYKMIINYPTSPLSSDDLYDITFNFTRNLPVDIDNEATAAQKLMGVTSHETAISVVSIVDDPVAELEKIRQENMDASEVPTDYNLDRVPDDAVVVGGGGSNIETTVDNLGDVIETQQELERLNGAQTTSLAATVRQYNLSELSQAQAAAIIMRSLNISRDDAIEILGDRSAI